MTYEPTLPIDVQEIVIDDSAHDLLTLRHCALTCRDWLPRSRFHLLSAVRISTQEDIYSFCDFLDAHPERRSLILSITMAPDVSEKRPACLLETFPIQLLLRLPNLRRWTFRNDLSGAATRIVSHHPITLKQLRISSPIQDLHLQSLRFISHPMILRFITSFTRLKHLRCKTIRIAKGAAQESKPFGIGTLGLSTLHVEDIPVHTLRTLLDLTALTLESLTIVSPQNVDGVSTILSRMPRLRSLEFGIKFEWDMYKVKIKRIVTSIGRPAPASFGELLGMPPTAVPSNRAALGMILGESNGWDMIAKALDSAHHLTLESLRVNLVINTDLDLELPDQRTADNITSAVVQSKLQSLTLDVHAKRVHPAALTHRLLARFSKLCEEGLQPRVVFSGATFLREHYWAESGTITMSPDGTWVAGSTVGGILLWKMREDASVRPWRIPFSLPNNAITQAVFSPDGAQLLVVSQRHPVAYIWDVERARVVTTIACDPIVGAWSCRCLAFVTRADTISTYDPSTYLPIHHHHHYTFGRGRDLRPQSRLFRPGLQFSPGPDHRWLAASCPERGRSGYAWTIWKVADDGRLAGPTVLSRRLRSRGAASTTPDKYSDLAAFSPDGTRMAVVGQRPQLHIWDTATATCVLAVDLAATRAGRICGNIGFSADGRRVFVIRRLKGPVEVWDADTGRLLDPLVVRMEDAKLRDEPWWGPSMATCFSPCGRYLVASPITSGGVMVWRTRDGSLVRRI